MAKLKNIIMKVILFLKENIQMEKEVMEKNMIFSEILYLKDIFWIEKGMEKVKNILKIN